MSFIKISEQWKSVLSSYMKVGGSWVTIPTSSLPSYLGNGAMIWGGYQSGFVVHSLLIGGASTVEAETSQFQAIYDGQPVTGATWSVASGSSYASIDATGSLTVNSAANKNDITVACSYNGLEAIKAVEVTYKSGSSASTTTETTVDPDTGETTTTTTTVTENPDGTTTTSQTATTYDEEGNETGHVQTDTDVQGNVNTQTVEKNENGDDVVIGYTIDTENNPSGSEVISSGDGINTGFMPFSVSNQFGFEINMTFRCRGSEQPTGQHENHHNIFSMKRTQTPWIGVMFRITNQTDSAKVRVGVQFSTSNQTLDVALTSDYVYSLRLTYDPSLSSNNVVLYDKLRNVTLKSWTGKFNIAENLPLTIGYALDENNQPYRFANITVYDFSIVKI